MDHQLNNPLRPSTKLTRTNLQTSTDINTPSTKISTSDPLTTPETKIITAKTKTSPSLNQIPTPSVNRTLLKPEVKKALDELNASDDLRNLIAQLSQNGIELAGPKKVYVKHSYEIDLELHQKFHKMYPVLGYKKVKEAINDAIADWCEKNEIEFQRRNGSNK